jgi:hypothetical protein
MFSMVAGLWTYGAIAIRELAKIAQENLRIAVCGQVGRQPGVASGRWMCRRR